MKIYPIISFNGIQAKNDIKEKKPFPKQNPIEKVSLETLSNYNKGGLLSFRGQ